MVKVVYEVVIGAVGELVGVVVDWLMEVRVGSSLVGVVVVVF